MFLKIHNVKRDAREETKTNERDEGRRKKPKEAKVENVTKLLRTNWLLITLCECVCVCVCKGVCERSDEVTDENNDRLAGTGHF